MKQKFRKITLTLLRRKHACGVQRRLFQKLFGNGGEVTQDRCVRGALAGLNFYWARNLLAGPALTRYDAAETKARRGQTRLGVTDLQRCEIGLLFFEAFNAKDNTYRPRNI